MAQVNKDMSFEEGGGKYGDMLAEAKERMEARSGLLIMIHGRHGSGCSVAADLNDFPGFIEALRSIADNMELQFIAANKEIMGG